MDFIEGVFKAIPKILMKVVKVLILIILSVVVLPSMLVMLTLHGPWENMLNDLVKI